MTHDPMVAEAANTPSEGFDRDTKQCLTANAFADPFNQDPGNSGSAAQTAKLTASKAFAG